jgi:hypothetical protein
VVWESPAEEETMLTKLTITVANRKDKVKVRCWANICGQYYRVLREDMIVAIEKYRITKNLALPCRVEISANPGSTIKILKGMVSVLCLTSLSLST